MRPLRLFFLVLGLGYCAGAWASDFRVSMLGGLGNSVVTARGGTQTEAPFAMSAIVETIYSSRLTLGLEHSRTLSLKPAASAVSASGLLFRYYFLNYPVRTVEQSDGEVSYLQQRSWALFAGVGTGFAQSSLLPTEDEAKITNSVAIYLKFRTGVDIPLGNRWGCQSEAALGTTVFGVGTITTVQFVGGVYYVF